MTKPVSSYVRVSWKRPAQGATEAFEREGWFYNEPLFVPSPGPPVSGCRSLSMRRLTSRIVVLDATTLEWAAQRMIPQVIPFHFPGQLVPAA